MRCGQCDEVFDASQNLFQESVASAPETTPEVGVDTAYPSPVTDCAQPDSQPDQDPWLDESRDVRDEVQVDLPRDNGQAALSDAQTDLLNLATSPADSMATLEHVAVDFHGQISQDGVHELPAVSFMRGMPKSSVWHQPLVRATLGLTGFLLMIGLAVQIVVHERDRLVAMQPQSRPMLDALCATLKCGLSPLRQIESIVIDNASFSKIQGDTYRLGLSVKNTAAIELAMPSLELTLTDSQDQTVLRRVLMPAEFDAASDVIATGGEWSGTVALNVRGAVGAERISGYRVLAFYP